MSKRLNPTLIITVLAGIQFVNILNFMVVMPLGPDFAKELHIPLSDLGLVGGVYTLAAAVGGLGASSFLDRMGRRKALSLTMLGFALTSALGALAYDLNSMLASRVAAGLFSGPAMALVMAVITDVIPPEKRGRAMGAVMSGFALASVLGVPFGLELAHLWDWRAALLGVAVMGALASLGAWVTLPPLKGHLDHTHDHATGLKGYAELFRNPNINLTLGMAFLIMSGSFLLLANLAAYVQVNLGFPRHDFSILYLTGGVVSYFATRGAGPLVDKTGAFRLSVFSSLVLIAVYYWGFIHQPVLLSVFGIYVGFMLGNSFRMVAFSTLTTHLPRPHERGRFMGLLTAVQNFAAASGALLSPLLLSEAPDGHLLGMPHLAWLSVAMALVFLPMIRHVERKLKPQPLTEIPPLVP